ncbi:hypothetical protein C0J52_27269 [Blattella germanica]|nr:hypothetical protein C0J52_27269 [Blattella germanica]
MELLSIDLFNLFIYTFFCWCPCQASNQHAQTKVNTSKNTTKPCSEMMSVEITKFNTFSNGSVLALDDIPTMYPAHMIWNSTDRRNATKMWGCLCAIKHCIRKCCPEHTTIAAVDGRCISSSNPLLYPFRPELVDPDTKQKFTSNFSDDIRLLYENPCTNRNFVVDPYYSEHPENFTLLSTGELITDIANYTNEEYCIEALPVGRILPLVCFPEIDVDESVGHKTEMSLVTVLLCFCWLTS